MAGLMPLGQDHFTHLFLVPLYFTRAVIFRHSCLISEPAERFRLAFAVEPLVLEYMRRM